ncbi:MAG: hypothetical protein ACKVZJ_12365 [Phycisphaerales bacterium]
MPKMVLSCREAELIREVGDPVPVSWAAGLGIDPARCRIKVWEKPRPGRQYAAECDVV